MCNNQSFQALNDLFFVRIFQSFRIAIHHIKLIIAFLALTVICLAGWLMDFSNTVVVQQGMQGKVTELQIYLSNPEQLDEFIERNSEKAEHTGVFSMLWGFSTDRFRGIVSSLFTLDRQGVIDNVSGYLNAIRWVLNYHTVYCGIFFIIKLIVISIAGGAICRIAALQFARGEKAGLIESLNFSFRRFKSFVSAPLVPVVIIVITSICIFVVGLLGNIPVVGELLISVSMPVILFAGVLISLVFIGTFGGFNLMFPAVAYDGSDCVDAISRSFSYVYAKPWRMIFYTAVAGVYGAACYVFIRFVAFLILFASYWSLRFGIWAENSVGVNKLALIWPQPDFASLAGIKVTAEMSWSQSVAGFLVNLFLYIIVGLVISFLISFYFSANTIIYSLMRKSVDNTDTSSIYLQSPDAMEIDSKNSTEK